MAFLDLLKQINTYWLRSWNKDSFFFYVRKPGVLILEVEEVL